MVLGSLSTYCTVIHFSNIRHLTPLLRLWGPALKPMHVPSMSCRLRGTVYVQPPRLPYVKDVKGRRGAREPTGTQQQCEGPVGKKERGDQLVEPHESQKK